MRARKVFPRGSRKRAAADRYSRSGNRAMLERDDAGEIYREEEEAYLGFLLVVWD